MSIKEQVVAWHNRMVFTYELTGCTTAHLHFTSSQVLLFCTIHQACRSPRGEDSSSIPSLIENHCVWHYVDLRVHATGNPNASLYGSALENLGAGN